MSTRCWCSIKKSVRRAPTAASHQTTTHLFRAVLVGTHIDPSMAPANQRIRVYMCVSYAVYKYSGSCWMQPVLRAPSAATASVYTRTHIMMCSCDRFNSTALAPYVCLFVYSNVVRRLCLDKQTNHKVPPVMSSLPSRKSH